MPFDRQNRVSKAVRDGWFRSHRVLNRVLDVTGNSRFWAEHYVPGTPEYDLAKSFAEARRLVDRISADPDIDPREAWDQALADYIDRHRGEYYG